MKKINIILLALVLASSVQAKSKISFGLQGGLDLPFVTSEHKVKTGVGYATAFEFGYGYYWSTSYHTLDWGIQTGLIANFASSSYEADFSHQFTNLDYLGNELLYTTSGNVGVQSQRLKLELPILVGMQAKGFVLNIGPKIGLPVWSQSKQSLSTPNVDAYYTAFDVHVVNELVTGKVDDTQLSQSFKNDAPTFNLHLVAKLGYEWELKNNNALGLVACIDYNVWNTFAGNSANPLIMVAPITNPAYPVPTVTINNAAECVAQRINPLQVSISFYYSIYHEPWGRRKW